MKVMPDSTLEVLQRAALREDQAEAIFAQGRNLRARTQCSCVCLVGVSPRPAAQASGPADRIAVGRHKQAKRLVKRLRRHCEDLFTFLNQPGVPFGNNHAKRIIRPLFIFDGGSYGNRSQRGADCQAVLMSVFRTLKQRGHDPVSTICNAIATYLKTRQLPPLPANIVSNG